MRSLFLRIFLWFWLAMAVVVAVLVITSPFFTRSRPALEEWHEDAESGPGSGRQRLRPHRRGGDRRCSAGPRSRSRERDEGRHAPGAGVHPRRGRYRAPGTRRRHGRFATLAVHVLSAGEEQSERSGTLYLVARPVVDPDGRKLAVVAAHHSPPRLEHLLEPQALGWRLAVARGGGRRSELLARALSQLARRPPAQRDEALERR